MIKLQQGDVNLEQVNHIPENVRKVSKTHRGYVLAEGEATGHAHVIEEEVELFEIDGILYIKNDSSVELKHEEHKIIEIPTGTWKVTPTYEYDYFEQMDRTLAD